MDVFQTIPDIINACRLCLVENINIRSIFDTNNNIKWLEKDLSRQIFECTNITVSEVDGPTGICHLCLHEIWSIIRFRKKCYLNDIYLKKTYHEDYIAPEENSSVEMNLTQDCFIPFIDLGCEESFENEELAFSESPDSYSSYEKIEEPNDSYFILPNDYYSDLVPSKHSQGLCHICGLQFKQLLRHLHSHREDQGEPCTFCGKEFKWKESLRLHVLTHTSGGDFPCEICGKKFVNRVRLKNHSQRHAGNRPFKCEICPKRCYTKYNLKIHNRMHTGERPYICQICYEAFPHGYSLKNHMEKRHTYSE